MPLDAKFAVVCSSNQNRSMEAHYFLSKRGYNVKSYGTGTYVKLPGSSQSEPNIYTFETTYDHMRSDLIKKDRALYTQNGVIDMLERNRRIKPHPQRFQDTKEKFDVIITVEERVYDTTVDFLSNREDREGTQAVHVINIDIQDNHEEATLGAFEICDLATLIVDCDDIDNEIDEIIQEFSGHSQRPVLHTVCFY